MSLTREEYLVLMEEHRLMHMFIEEASTAELLLMVMQQRHPDLPLVTVADVRTHTTSFSICDPGSLVTIYYRDASVRFIGDRWNDIGQVTIRLTLGKYGRILQERVVIEHMVVTNDGVVLMSQKYNRDS